MYPILVVGGAGYIGAHTCLDLASRGFLPVTYDNLSTGHDDFVRWGPLEIGDIRDGARLDAVFRRHRPIAIVHFAAQSEIGRSVADPLGTFDINVGGTVSLLAAAERAGIDKLVFSSTCAVYGRPQASILSENHVREPINPYGRSKLMIEEIIDDLGRLKGLQAVVLRYFNAAGADPECRIGERHDPETHAIPLAIATALGRREGFTIFGTDYDTPDGTAIRDYVHVLDLAAAHGLAVEHLIAGRKGLAVNLGTGTGTSVRELVETVGRISGRGLSVVEGPRRAGDPSMLVANNQLARDALGWTPRHDLSAMVETAYRWHASQNR
ncbi:UDP-galactose 4-epimerase [Fulvimarina manganoxydans]|uniref:UDP-glucose 4-epimerase n=1 Tax=Fulvimarina manganoxydans TaxID=937218 RepID=A0A1W1Z8S7_9HYPH|nr:UDP-glucose 4-epimerase GalE [Fulvimarina manganoxydans]MEE2950396.1 UDP-glucose 4-epimerase GalE [Pseudomonadota bacterium]SMC44830.1 UDP-galactose 4-epimerase [Fulvimarina manganoxydans]